MTINVQFLRRDGTPGATSLVLFPGAFAEMLRLAEMWHLSAIWCDPRDLWVDL